MHSDGGVGGVVVTDRPTGKKSVSSTATDDVTPPPALPEDASVDDRTERGRPRGDSAHDGTADDERTVDDDVLDVREQRKSASRKAPGPPDDRVGADDVVIETTPIESVGPTEPG